MIQLTKAHLWGLAVSAVLTEANPGGRHDLLWSTEKNTENIEFWKKNLYTFWGVTNTREAKDQLHWLKERGGHRKGFRELQLHISTLSETAFIESVQLLEEENPSLARRWKIVKRYMRVLNEKGLIGWDLARYVSLCRWCTLVNFISENEALERIMDVAIIVQGVFSDWDDLAMNYLIGRQYGFKQTAASSAKQYVDAYLRLKSNPDSPYNTISWHTNLNN